MERETNEQIEKSRKTAGDKIQDLRTRLERTEARLGEAEGLLQRGVSGEASRAGTPAYVGVKWGEDVQAFLSTSTPNPEWVSSEWVSSEGWNEMVPSVTKVSNPDMVLAEQKEIQQCDAACPHSSFEHLHCSLSKGHSGPHNWVAGLQVALKEDKP